MRKTALNLVFAAVLGLAMPGLVTQAAAQDSEAQAPKAYSVSTTKVAVLLDDPAAAAILKELIPGVYANEMFQTMGRDQTLQNIQQYEPTDLSDENLAKIQAAFDKLAKKLPKRAQVEDERTRTPTNERGIFIPYFSGF